MSTPKYTVGPDVDHHTPTQPLTVLHQPNDPHLQPATTATAAALTLYQVPVPGAVEVQLPNGRTAWARPVEHHLAPAAVASREPMPAWAKAVSAVACSATALALGSALALRIAQPALGALVEVLDIAFRVALVLAVILFGTVVLARARLTQSAAHHADSSTPETTASTVVIAPHIDTGGTRLIGRGGDVTVQYGTGHRSKQ